MIALLAFAHLILSVDYNIVYVALPEIGPRLGFSAQSQQWVVSAYAVGFGGPVMGGVLTSYLGWAWVFFVNVPLALGAVLAARVLLPADPPRVSRWGAVDLPGALVATAGSTLVVFGLASGPEAGWGSLWG